jgi:hypothetical protein
MREHPWNIRRVTHRHLHDHRNLLDLHYLTHAWAGQDHSSLPNPFEKNASLEDDTSPEDVLIRLEQGVLHTQLAALSERLSSKSSLDELSWQAGRDCSTKRWPKDTESSLVEKPGPPDKRALLVALHHSPLSGRLAADAFLVRRALASEVSIELLNCPHAKSAAYGSEPGSQAIHELCRQQFNWLRGYLNHLHSAVTPILTVGKSPHRCAIRW